MPDQDKKVKTTEKSTDKKQQGITTRDYSDLKRLRCLLNVQSSKQQLPAINFDSAQNSMTKSEPAIKDGGHRARGQWHESTEAVELENFSINYKNERNFSKHPQHELFQEIFTALVKNRLICREWVNRAPSIHFLRVLICLRLLMRDPCYQEILHTLGGIENLAQYMEIVANEYLGYGEEQHSVDKLVNMTYIFQKLAAVKDQREWVTASGAHKILVNLLGARDTNVLLGALLALASLAESPECREKISELNVVESLLMILHEYDLLSKRLTAELLRLLCAEPQVKEQVKLYEGIPVLLSLLHSDHLKLLWSVVWILVQVCEDPETSVEIRIWGGIKQLLHILRGDRNFVSDRSSIGSLSSANAAGRIQQLHLSEDLSPREIQENTFSLQAACCAALTELVLNDTNAHQVVQENGVYTIAKLILPNKQKNAAKTNLLQCYAFRALRFLFSMERNRPLFKRLFPTDLFEIFIDIGHYVRDISAYEELVSKFNLLAEDELKQIAENIESINQNKAPSKYIGNYAILDHLGSGAFGCVYKVRKRSGQNLLAMKEVNLHNPAFGKDKKDRDSSVKNIVSELTIIKEQLYHPNVVRYHKTFLENDRLYIVMELIEGAPLGEHFSSLKEKQLHFTEERLWKIFIQLCLALRYLHKEKRIVHRDLTPNNIMLGDKDKVTVTDFGLAKQKQESSKLTSVVGTILYSWDFTGGVGSRPRPALLPLDLLLKVPPLRLRAHIKEVEAELVTGWQSHSLPAVILRSLKDHASAGIAVSQRKVRQISDPIQQILIQLHKIIYITQLPPALHHNLKRRVIERFKKSLFSQQSNPCNLKSEIKKLSQGSPEPIEPNFFTADYHLLHHSTDGNSLSPSDPTGLPTSFDLEEGITYEQMQTVIEEVLEESGYYNFTSNRYHSYPWGTKTYPTKR
ncbi:NIMA related kinase 10 [Phyllostomus discolor]|uniref:NIMA related kinase 10 n=1 Tax=Phyllostomus discolor TaxID=89673 RepID=A0A833ZX21_9CHIR|nr:NIMA related kinase 10 [Phyllostomus discolor]